MRQALLVLGMHRSGTSAFTRTLSLLGAALPKNLMPPKADNNETGFWEPQRLADLHDRMLAEAGSSWDDWRSFDVANLAPSRAQFYRAEIARLLEEEYGDAKLWVLKEPRISRFAAFYADILGTMKVGVHYILVGRNPLSVAASLAERDGFTRGFGALLWLRHELAAERASRGQSRVFLSYEGILRNWRETTDKVARALAIEWPRSVDEAASEIEAHLSSSHQHHTADENQLSEDLTIVAWVKEAYAAIKMLEQGESETQPLMALDRVGAEFDSTARILNDTFYGELEARGQKIRGTLGIVEKLAREREEELQRLNASRAHENSELQSKITVRDTLLAERQAELQELRELLAQMERSIFWRVTSPLRILRARWGRQS